MSFVARATLAAVLLGSVSACAKVQAKTPAPAPLAVPAPPPRVVVPVTLPAPPPAEPTTPSAQPTAASNVAHPRDTPPPVTTTAPSKPADKPAPAVEPPAPPPSSDVIELERQTQTLLNEAQRDLNRVVASTLNTDALAQYNQAKRFVTQAQDALRKKQYFYAKGLADKAATLASQLPKGKSRLAVGLGAASEN